MRSLIASTLFLAVAATAATAQCLTPETARRGYVLFTDQGAETHRFTSDSQITERVSSAIGLSAPSLTKMRYDMSNLLPVMRSQETLSLGEDRWPDDRYALRLERQILQLSPFSSMAAGESMNVMVQESRRENSNESGAWRSQSRTEPVMVTYTLKGQSVMTIGSCRYPVWLIESVSVGKMTGSRTTSRLAYSPDVLFFLNSTSPDGREHPVERIETMPY